MAFDPTRTEMLRREYSRKLAKLPEKAKAKVLETIRVKRISEETLNELKSITELEMGPEAAKRLVENYNSKLYRKGSEFAGKQLKKVGVEIAVNPQLIEIIDQDIIREMNNLSLDLIKGLTDETKKKLAYELRTGWMQGESIPKLSDRVRSVFKASKTRAEMIARTESIRVFNTAAVRRYERAGVKKWKWITAVDERTCSICMPLNGRIFRIGEHPPPPAHPRCRCTVVPVLDRGSGKASEISEITGDPELDNEINSALNSFDKILKEEGNYVRALNRFVNKEKLDVEEARRKGAKILKKYFGRGGPEEVRSYIQNVLPFRINEKVIERAGKVSLKTTSTKWYAGRYDPINKVIEVSKLHENKANTFMHEFGHHLEHSLYAEKSRKFFLARVRKHGYKLELLKKHKRYEHVGYDIYHFDGFDHIDPYMGRIYLGRYESEHRKRMRRLLDNPKLIELDDDIRDNFTTEFVSVGLAHFTREETMKRLYEKDKEVFGFILSLLR